MSTLIHPSDCRNSDQLLRVTDSELLPLRDELYNINKPGYIILRNYISPAQVAHLQQFWQKTPPDRGYFDTHPVEPKVFKQRPFAFFGQRRTCYHNYLWNPALDELSHTLCFEIALLRNRLQEKPSYFNLAPNGKRLASYRVIVSGTYKEGDIEVEPHQDFSEEQYIIGEPDSQKYLQATLFLSERGVDYTGNGFHFTTNQGEKIYPGRDLDIKPGDLMIWRYINWHGVDGTQALHDGVGFLRMIYPHEDVVLNEVRIEKPSLLKKWFQNVSK